MKPWRLLGQPADGFATITEAIDWLEAQGLIGPEPANDEERRRGWGNPFCVVTGARGDPWEGER